MLKLHEDGVGWKSKVTGNVIAVSKGDLRKVEWIKIPHAYQLRIKARGGFVYKYNGFRGSDKETVKAFVQKAFGLELEDVSLCYKGWNWGAAKVEGGSVSFSVEDKVALEVPLTEVAQATAQKNEAVVEMQDDDTALPEDEIITEIRFFIPPPKDEEEAGEDGTPAEGFVELIKQSGDLEVGGQAALTLDDMQVQVPRGRYDIELFDKYMKLHGARARHTSPIARAGPALLPHTRTATHTLPHRPDVLTCASAHARATTGKTNDYKVLYTNVASLYLLPKPDGHNMALSIALEHPLRQGATSYPQIVLQLPREEPRDVEVMMTEAECKARFGDKLDKYENGDTPSVVAKVVSAFTGRKVVGIKSGGFNADSHDDRTKSIRCSLKALDGFLYPLDKAFYFLSNKPALIELERVGSVEFNRVDASAGASAARTFDITIHMKDGSGDQQFVNLQRQDYKEFLRFLQAKKVRIKNFASAGYGEGRGDRDDDDDPYLATIKRERREAQAEALAEEGSDDDDEDDESFKGGDSSSADEEYDEGSDSGDSEKGFKGGKKEKKKAKEESGSDSGSGSDSDSEEKKPKKKKKEKLSAKAAGKRKAESDDDAGIMSSKKKKSPKKKKAKKDPNAPKRGMSAYMLWMNQDGRAKVKASNPDAGLGEVGKLCGAMWKEMGPEAKAKWEEKAKADKARYETEMKAYKSGGKAAAADSGSEEEAADSDDDAGSDSD